MTRILNYIFIKDSMYRNSPKLEDWIIRNSTSLQDSFLFEFILLNPFRLLFFIASTALIEKINLSHILYLVFIRLK